MTSFTAVASLADLRAQLLHAGMDPEIVRRVPSETLTYFRTVERKTPRQIAAILLNKEHQQPKGV